ncbi:MAG TPA: ABC transporter ATP-binding protein [Actinomycetota bacterium]|nr:ABC transporter ATP-binding protein [Actinomycetota bacterium]
MEPLAKAERLSRWIDAGGKRHPILEDLNFVIPRGSLFVINGPSGSGKSTLLNLLTGVDRPSSGGILFSHERMPDKGENALAQWRGRTFGIVFQSFQLIPTLSALDNVILALELGKGHFLRKHWASRALECLAQFDVADLAHRLPRQMSGGQQQRVAIARAMANDPPIVVADEPTGNLDTTAASGVIEALRGLVARGKTVVLVTHDADIARRGTAGIDLMDGRIVGRRLAPAFVAA